MKLKENTVKAIAIIKEKRGLISTVISVALIVVAVLAVQRAWKYPELEKENKALQASVSEANKKLEEFCKELSEKGVQIIENNVMIVTDGKNCTASGDIKVIEPIGVRKATSLTELPQEGQMEDESDGNGN